MTYTYRQRTISLRCRYLLRNTSHFVTRFLSFRQVSRLLLGLALLSLPIACDKGENIRFGGNGGSGGSGSFTPEQVTARMEMPASLTGSTTLTLTHYASTSSGKQVVNYAYEYDITKYHSRWVAFRFDGNTRAKNVSRSDEPFADDPLLPTDCRIGSKGFGGRYNRGHLCASADRLYSYEANVQTFYMSNMSPQLASFNQGYWITLEGQVQSLGRDASFADTLYVVKGGTIRDSQILGYVYRDNDTKVAIPKYYYMALLKVKNGSYSSIAFWIEHKEYGYSYNNQAPLSVIASHAVSVNQLESLTGINFFPNLPNDKEESIENSAVPANWRFD